MRMRDRPSRLIAHVINEDHEVDQVPNIQNNVDEFKNLIDRVSCL